MTAQLELNTLLMDWDRTLTEYAGAVQQAAAAEAEYKRLRARVVITEKHRDPKAALSLCEAIAEADQTVADAYLERLSTGGRVDAMKGKLGWFRAAADGKRSEVASERENARLYSTHGAGA